MPAMSPEEGSSETPPPPLVSSFRELGSWFHFLSTYPLTFPWHRSVALLHRVDRIWEPRSQRLTSAGHVRSPDVETGTRCRGGKEGTTPVTMMLPVRLTHLSPTETWKWAKCRIDSSSFFSLKINTNQRKNWTGAGWASATESTLRCENVSQCFLGLSNFKRIQG